jgi:microcystin-dependent protein
MSAAEPFLGEIYMFGGNFAPVNWALCNGQLMSIAQNTALFSLLGTTYGGDGVSTFALPDLRGRIPIHRDSNSHLQGAREGSENVTLDSSQMPIHAHRIEASIVPSSLDGPGGNVAADSTAAGVRMYAIPTTPAVMSPNAVGQDGGGQPHSNIMPYLCVNFIIALAGVFPARN